MKRQKIIYINQRAYGRYFPETGSDDFYLFGVGHFLAEQLQQRYTNLLFENWRCDNTIGNVMKKNVRGIGCRVFPSFRRKRYGEFSLSLLKELHKEFRSSEVVLHLMGLDVNFYSLIAYMFGGYPIVATHLGGANFRFKYETTGNTRSYLRDMLERKLMRFYDHIFVQTKTEKDYLLKSMCKESVSHGPIYGFDFDIFKRKNKLIARKKLNWPLDKKIMLSVGRAFQLKGIGNVLDAFAELKDEGILLFMVDVQPNDPLYSRVAKSGAMFTGSINYHRLPLYYSASDVLIYLPFDNESLNFAGPGYVNMECLACGTPVVSTLVRHFPDPDIRKVCRIPEKPEDVVPMIKDILSNPPTPEACRNVVFRYYKWDRIVAHHSRVYKQLFQRYYGVDI